VRALVTGGGGFLGRRIVELLLERGDEVTSVSRGRYPQLEALGAGCLQADLADRRATLDAIQGAEVVFHVAAKAGVWGPRREYERTNVLATRHVIEACRAAGVGRLVFTSSPSVCFDGRDHLRAGNDLPYAEHYLAHYPRTKAEAERAVLAANGGELATVALRPHLIFGPRDPHLLPRLVARAERGRLAVVGSGENEVSVTYVDNAAWAHLDAAQALAPGAACAGRAYFVAGAEPVRLWDWIADLLQRLDKPAVRRRVPSTVARAAGAVCELLWRVARLRGEPPMTRFLALQLARSHSYDLGPIERDLGYRERVGMPEALERTLAAWS